MSHDKHQTIRPLAVSTKNPRYFATKDDNGNEQAVYLTGSHIWNNLQDGLGPGKNAPTNDSEKTDFSAYLTFLKERNHNFIRLWRWEQFKSNAGGADFHLNMSPQPWLRSGEGKAKDDLPKFDLTKFNKEYFDRLRERVIAAGQQGIYVDIMLFEGWGIHLSPAPDNIEGHPFFAENNINGISITSILDHQVLPLSPAVQELQEAYMKKVIDTVHDLPNVLYEVSNESSGGGKATEDFLDFLGMTEIPEWGDSTEWQYWVIDFVKNYEKERGYDHRPMGMTMQFPVKKQTKVNEPLLNSKAEWISPGYDDEIFAHGGHPMDPNSPESHWYDNPPVADGKKIIISDTDHYAPGKGDALWAWKSFLRGHHPILMDYGIMNLKPHELAPGEPPFEAYEPARNAMGDTLAFARRMQLVDMQPSTTLSSTKYALANPGKEYLILQPDSFSEPLSVTIEAGNYTVEWFDLLARETKQGSDLSVKKTGSVTLASPFGSTPVALYIKASQ